VELEQGIVYGEFIALEPFEKVTDDGKSVDDGWSHIDAKLILSLMEECLGQPQTCWCGTTVTSLVAT